MPRLYGDGRLSSPVGRYSIARGVNLRYEPQAHWGGGWGMITFYLRDGKLLLAIRDGV